MTVPTPAWVAQVKANTETKPMVDDEVQLGSPPSWAFDEADDHEVDALMGIAEVCELYKVSPRALRFYETKGLLAPRRINGTRVYNKVDRARLTRILRAKSLGTPLAEIKHYLDLYGDNGEGRTQQLAYVVERTDLAIRELEAKRAGLDATLAELRLFIKENT